MIVYQLLAHGRWFSPGTPASSTTKAGRHDIAESGIKHQKNIFKTGNIWFGPVNSFFGYTGLIVQLK